jgi:hypothetical protein
MIAEFSGVTSAGSVSFVDLKWVFYSVLDVLSADVEASRTSFLTLNACDGSSCDFTNDSLMCLSKLPQVLTTRG